MQVATSTVRQDCQRPRFQAVSKKPQISFHLHGDAVFAYLPASLHVCLRITIEKLYIHTPQSTHKTLVTLDAPQEAHLIFALKTAYWQWF